MYLGWSNLSSKIRINLTVVSVVSVLLTALFLLFIMTNSVEDSYEDYIRSEAIVIAEMYKADVLTDSMLDNISNTDIDTRITLLMLDGTVTYDSEIDSLAMDNHLDRPEVIEALISGEGFASRASDTTGIEYYYYAILLDDIILRVSVAVTSPLYVLNLYKYEFMVIIGLIILMCIPLSTRLTKQIVTPIYNLKLDEPDQIDGLYNELLPFVQKIAQQKIQINQNIEALEERTSTIQTITQSIGEGMAMIDSRGDVVSVNNSFKSLINRNGIINLPQKMIYLTRNQDILKAAEAVIKRENYSCVFEKNERYFRVIASYVETGGGIIFFSDITEEEISSRTRREFSANVSHELRTPLTSISGYGELLKIGMVNPDNIRSFGDKIHGEAQRMIALIENIMKLSKLDELSSADRSDFSEVSLKSVARNVLQRLSFKVEEMNISLSHIGEDVRVMGNADMIENMVYNLAENAIKYNKPNGSVVLETAVIDGFGTITVKDTGVGIPAEDSGRIFERFYRVDKSRMSKTGGSGIGLAIVKHIGDYHGCKITVDSKLDIGTNIKVAFPLH